MMIIWVGGIEVAAPVLVVPVTGGGREQVLVRAATERDPHVEEQQTSGNPLKVMPRPAGFLVLALSGLGLLARQRVGLDFCQGWTPALPLSPTLFISFLGKMSSCGLGAGGPGMRALGLYLKGFSHTSDPARTCTLRAVELDSCEVSLWVPS